MTWKGTIPVYINNFNRLTTTRKLAKWFDDVPGTELIIIDNASTYPPLLDWYVHECPYKIVRLDGNGGHHAPWKQACVLHAHTHRAIFGSEWYIVTDPDLDLADVPKDLVDVLLSGFTVMPNAVKVGVSLEIDDLPPVHSERVRSWEQQFWTRLVGDGFFQADIDTTLAIYRAETMHATAMTTNQGCLRTVRPYTARHMPWYLDPKNLSAEETYYFQQANGCTTWRP